MPFARIVDQAHELIEVSRDVFRGEIVRRHLAVATEFAVPVLPLPVEALGRRAQMNGQDFVDDLECVQLRLAHRVEAGFLFVQISDLRRALPHLVIEDAVHLASRARALSLRHRRLGHDAVLLDQVYEHVPLTGVLNRRAHQVLDYAIVGRSVRGFDNCLQDEVGAFDLVPEHHVALAELELLDVHLVHRVESTEIQPREQPATSRRALIRGRPIVEHSRIRMVGGRDDVPVKRNLVDVVDRDRVLHQAVARIGVVLLSHRRQVLRLESDR